MQHDTLQLNGHCQVHSFDEYVAVDRSTDESLTLGEMLPAREDDPATQACQRLDWNDLVQQLDEITRSVLLRPWCGGREVNTPGYPIRLFA